MSDDTRCSVEGCDNSGSLRRGWCEKHYSRWRRHGDPVKTLVPQFVVGTPEERFWPKVDVSGVCWEWTGVTNAKGYGEFNSADGSRLAHRVAWGFLVGSIPEGLVLDHLCRNPPCVNPDHLEPVTQAENMRRGIIGLLWSQSKRNSGVRRVRSLRSHCAKGHEYTEENTHHKPNGDRICRTCQLTYMRAYHERKRQAKNEA